MLNGMSLSPDDLQRTGRSLALWSVLASAGLSLVKIVVGLAANSTAVVSDGFEAAADVLSSGFVYVGLWLASRPPDDNHPYGHGRYEMLASLAVGGILVFTGFGICLHSFLTLSQPERVRFFAIYPLLAALGVKVTFAVLKWRSAKRLSSSSLAADAWHDITDLFSTTVALTAVVISLADPSRFHKADHIGGMIIAMIVVFVGVRLVRQTALQLSDAMPDERSMIQIRAAALRVPGALGIEKCFARRTGFKYHVDLHLEVDPNLTVLESHEIAAQVKTEVKARVDWVADVLVHVEPAPEVNAKPQPKPARRSIAGR
jgi:cation diffusion facilitator family transporter